MFVDLLGNTRIKVALHAKMSKTCDGRSPEDVARAYFEEGYDAIAVTDSWKYTDEGELSGIMIISGCEYDVGADGGYGKYHVIGIGMTSDPEIPADWKHMIKTSAAKAAEIVKRINFHNGFSFLSRSALNGNVPEEILELSELGGIEIFGATPERIGKMGYSGQIVDSLASMGCVLPVVAADDSICFESNGYGETVMVEATDLDMQSIVRALKAGRFYSTQGPELHLIMTAPDRVKIICSPSDRIEIFTNCRRTEPFVIEGEGIVEADYTVDKNESFVRAQLTDTLGRRAWSNIIKLDTMH